MSRIPTTPDLQAKGLMELRDNLPAGVQLNIGHLFFRHLEPEIRAAFARRYEEKCAAQTAASSPSVSD